MPTINGDQLMANLILTPIIIIIIELTILKHRRGQCKAVVTRARSYLNKLEEQEVTERTRFEIRKRLELLSSAYSEYREIQVRIDVLEDGSSTRSHHDEELEEFEEAYIEITSKLEELQGLSIASASASNSIVQQAQPREVNVLNPIQLQPIPIPEFKGEYSKWIEFRDAFSSLIHENASLSNLQKFHYLRGALKGEAFNVVNASQLSAADYLTAWESLLEKYNRNQFIIQSHIQNIIQLPAIKTESYKELRSLYDKVKTNLKALKNLGRSVEHWDDLLIIIIAQKLDPITKLEWDRFTSKHKEFSFKNLLDHISTKCDILEHRLEEFSKSKHRGHMVNINHVSKQNIHEVPCPVCKQTHHIFQCNQFRNFSLADKYKTIKTLKLCENCLRKGHFKAKCLSTGCKKCGKLHNTLLHPEENLSQKEHNDQNSNKAQTLHSLESSKTKVKIGILSTIQILVEDSCGNYQLCRAILDNGSTTNLITTSFCKKLGLQPQSVNILLTGVGTRIQTSQSKVNLTILSRNESYKFNTSCLVLPKITGKIPTVSLDSIKDHIPLHIKLADPEYYEPGKVDMLLGSAVFWECLGSNQIRLKDTGIILGQTKFGWILGGTVIQQQSSNREDITNATNVCLINSLNSNLQKFWQLEEVNPPIPTTQDSQYCEEHFKSTVKRAKDGKFIVTIPLKPNHSLLGNSRQQALKRFLNLERKLAKDTWLRSEYGKFMSEYVDMGHMQLIQESHDDEQLSYYIPHHPVVRKEHLTTKLRVVFDASMKTDSGLSFNDVQYIGYTVQRDLSSILLNFRLHKYVIGADISKMYRMIWINANQTKFHRIFWRADQHSPIQCYELQTVTYGTASAPFLATRSLVQVALELDNPELSRLIKEHFYVDDFLYSTDSQDELINIQHNLSAVLEKAGLSLRKWFTNCAEAYKAFKGNEALEHSILTFGEKDSTKALGIRWNVSTDKLLYQSNISQSTAKLITKRQIVAEIAKIFDPLGLLSPIIIKGKLIIQELWKTNHNWDEPVSSFILRQWNEFKTNLSNLSDIAIRRQVIVENHTELEIHGFGDASEQAYGAAIYIVSVSNSRKFSSLLFAKSRVAPLKQITLPRLELCAALLVAQMIKKAKEVLNIKFDRCYGWTDSTITLAWIKGESRNWKTFVANRVAEIQRLTDKADWYHVSSQSNPADIISRGTNTNQLINNSLWWCGPDWLTQESLPTFSHEETLIQENLEVKQVCHLQVVAETISNSMLSRFSSFQKMLRTLTYCHRFIRNCRNEVKQTEPLTNEEIQATLFKIIRNVQEDTFANEIKILKKGEYLNASNSLRTLNPFIDKQGILRVGGRLKNSDISFNQKHPIILHAKTHFSKLLLKHMHERLFHCGVQQLLFNVRLQYWIIKVRSLAKGIVRNCRICAVANPVPFSYSMGNLPEHRITKSFPFQHVGIDYAGPFQIKDRSTRGAKLTKSYVCLFVCFSTKAIHLEVVSDLSSENFIATLKRFISRRGKPSTIFCDNAKTFIGAKHEIRNLQQFLKSNKTSIQDFLTSHDITWKFIPPRAPNFGGLWEAGIRRVKYHLKRTMGSANLTYEQFNTLICQIEFILNSRPLGVLSDDPSDPLPLTPGHFLIGRCPSTIPERDYTLISENKLTQFERAQQRVQHFWKRWHKEYLTTLQQITKTTQNNKRTPKPGMLVIVKDETLGPGHWPLAIIQAVHPGDDGVVRVATVQLGQQLLKRAVSKLCPLPQLCQP